MIINPVFRKDMLGLLRLKRIAAVQVFFVAVMAAMVLASWPRGGVISIAAGSQDELLLGIVLGQLVVLILAVPGVAAVSLTGEKEANTLEMLYASRLSPIQIVTGKVLSAIAFPAVLLITGLPFVGLLAYRGAVDAGDLAWAYLILILTAVLLALLGLTISAFCRLTATALVLSYMLALFACGASLVPASIMLGPSESGTLAAVLHYARAFSPVAAVMSLLRPNDPGDFAGKEHGAFASHWVFVAAAVAASAACVGLLVARLRRPPAEADAVVGADGSRAGRRALYLIDPRRRRRPIGNLNPLFSKERRTNSLRSGRWMIRIFYAMLLLSLLLSVMTLYGGAEQTDLLKHVFQVLAVFQIVAAAAVSPSLTAPAVSGEIEGGTFETLRLSRLKDGQIFWGKLLPAVAPALLPILALLPAYGSVLYVNLGYETYLLRLMPVVLGAMALGSVLGLVCSCFAGSTARATVCAYIMTAALFMLPLLGWFAADAGLITRPWLRAVVEIPSPLVMGLSIHPEPDSAVFSLWGWHLALIVGVCAVLLAVSRVRLALLLRRG